MIKIKLLFMLVVLDFISDWYSLYKINKSSGTLSSTFQLINRLRGEIRTQVEEIVIDEKVSK